MKDIEKEEKIEEEVKEHPIIKKAIILLILIIISITLFINLIGNKIVEVKEYKITSSILPTSFNGIKIIQISDIHYGTTINKKELEKIVNKINDLKPDIIFFTGDLIDKNISLDDNSITEMKEILNKLECKQYKYAIYGDEDVDLNNYKDLIEDLDFKLLDNESTLLYYKDTTPIQIIGYNTIDSNPNYSIIDDPINEIETTYLYKIVLMHEPDAFDNIKEYNPNLVLSGHTLGNNIRLLGLDNLFNQPNAKIYNKDYYNKNNIDFYISSGLGTSNIKIRLNNQPSINLYRVYTE